MTRNQLTALGLLTAALVLAADQASKWWVRDVLDLPSLGSVAVLPLLNLTWVRNPGVTFGLLNSLGAWGTPVLVVGALVVVAALGVWLRRSERALVATAIGGIAGGAIGNVIDRVRFGWVEDFIHAHAWGWSWYVFNVADAAIVCGVAALVLDGMRARPLPGAAAAPALRRPDLADTGDRS
jgi:lipoprotein signal peptidase